MNIIEKRKGQLKGLGIALLVASVILLAVGITLISVAATALVLKVGMLIGGIVLVVLSIPGIVVGVIFTWTATAVKAVNGSIAEENLAMGTANMHKCANCGAALEEGKTICEKCEENLKP